MTEHAQLTVTSLHVYPIKSCRGVQLPNEAHVTPTGFAWDRQWMIVRETDGKFVTQRQEPRLALVHPELPEAAISSNPAAMPAGLHMRVTAPGQSDALQVLLDPPSPSAKQLQCTVWEWTGLAADVGDAAAAWFSSYLGKPVRLVRYAGAHGPQQPSTDPKRRPTDPAWAPANETAFSDGFPFLLISEASLEELNRHVPEELPMNRFRPSIIVKGAAPFEEDSWLTFTIDQMEFAAVKPCSRCKTTTIDQATAQVGHEPLDTLHKIRSGSKLGWAEAAGIKSWKHSVFMGQNLTAKQTSGTVKAGSRLSILSRRDATTDGALVWHALT